MKIMKVYHQNGQDAEVTLYSYADPAGSIPAGLYNMTLQKVIEPLQQLKEFVEEAAGKKK